MANKLLDTTLLIDLSRGSSAAADFVDKERDSAIGLFISVISTGANCWVP